MGEIASKEATSLRYWFRSKYNLPPEDVRYLKMTDEGIALEYEMFLAAEGKSLKECFNCECTTHRDKCPMCGTEISGDAKVDELFDRLEKGEELDLDAELRGGSWEPVKKGSE